MSKFQSKKFKFLKKSMEIKTKGMYSYHWADVVKADGDKYTFKFKGDVHTEAWDTPEEAFKGFCLWCSNLAKQIKENERAIRQKEIEANMAEREAAERKRIAEVSRDLVFPLAPKRQEEQPIQTEEQEEEIKAEADALEGEAQAIEEGVHIKATPNGINIQMLKPSEAKAVFQQPTQAPEVTPTSTESQAFEALKKLRNYTQFCAWVEQFGNEYRLFRLKDGEAVDNHQPYKGDGTVVTLQLANGSVSRPFARVIHRYFELVKI